MLCELYNLFRVILLNTALVTCTFYPCMSCTIQLFGLMQRTLARGMACSFRISLKKFLPCTPKEKHYLYVFVSAQGQKHHLLYQFFTTFGDFKHWHLWLLKLECDSTGGYMALRTRTNIEEITNDTHDWTCKVQIVDISRERQSPEKKLRYRNLILEDEQEQQVKAVIYADHIDDYADKLALLKTYLISAAKVKVSSTSYGRPIHKFYWVLDGRTITEEIEPTNELEKPLPPPTKLNITTFDSIAQMTPGPAMEIDILGVVIRCGPLRYAGRTQNRCREVTVCDERQHQFLLTLWDDFGEIEGTELEAKLKEGKEFPAFLGRNIGISPYQGHSLQTRFNSTIRINPTYPQALELINWAKTNKDMISGHAPANFVGSSALTVNPVHQQIIPIAEITLATSAGVFFVEAEMSIAGDLQDFCMLECSGCKQKKRTKERKQFDCPKCQQKTTLVPRCTFQIDLIDASGMTTAFISGDLAEKLLSMTVEEIYDTTCVKRQVLRIEHAQEMLSGRLFRIQMRKSSWMSSNVAQSNLTILSYTEKEHVSPLSIGERNTKKAKSLGTSMEASAAKNETSSSALSIEPSTPAKKL